MHDDSTISRAFPEAMQVLSYELDEPPLPKKFISVFPRWLGENQIDQLDCANDAEREARDEKLLALWERIFLRTRVFTLLDKKLQQAKGIHDFLSYCKPRRDKPATDFAFVLLPDLGAYYKEDWDDTNVAWYSKLSTAQPLFDWALESGLYVLEDWTLSRPPSTKGGVMSA